MKMVQSPETHAESSGFSHPRSQPSQPRGQLAGENVFLNKKHVVFLQKNSFFQKKKVFQKKNLKKTI